VCSADENARATQRSHRRSMWDDCMNRSLKKAHSPRTYLRMNVSSCFSSCSRLISIRNRSSSDGTERVKHAATYLDDHAMLCCILRQLAPDLVRAVFPISLRQQRASRGTCRTGARGTRVNSSRDIRALHELFGFGKQDQFACF
jgi:hypothetical protein